MNWQTILAAILLLLSAAISLIMAALVWRQRQSWSAWFFSVALSITIWSTLYALELMSPTLRLKTFWAQWQYLGIATLPVGWFLFAQSYAGRFQWITRRRVLALFIIPLLAIALAFTNERHHLFWVAVELNTNGPFATFDARYGPGWFLFFLYSYTLLFWGSLSLFLALRGLAALYRWQLTILLLSPALPWIANALYLTRLSPIPQLDLTTFAFTLSMLIFGLGMSRVRLFALPPIARSLVVQHMNIAMLVLDRNNVVVDANPAAEKLFGLAHQAAIGLPVTDVLGRWSHYAMPYMNAVVADTELRIQTDEGDPTTAQFFTLQISPILNEKQRVGGRLVLLQDITRLKEADRAVALAQAKTELLAKVGHELRTPLNGILGLAEMLEYGVYGAISSSQQEALARIVNRSRYLTRLVNDMLEQFRLEQEAFNLVVAPLQIRALLQQVVETSETAAAAKKLTLITQVDANVPEELLGDATRLFQILVNLVDNAIKFTPSGQIEIRVFCPDEEHWALAVKDAGIGIPPALHDQIFEPFQQASHPPTEAERGMGLGLAIVKQLVTLMAGQITVESIPQQGSTFTVTLPLQQATALLQGDTLEATI